MAYLFIYVNNTDTLACMWRTKCNKCKKFRDIRLYKPDVQNMNNTRMWFAAQYFSYFFNSDNIANYWMVYEVPFYYKTPYFVISQIQFLWYQK